MMRAWMMLLIGALALGCSTTDFDEEDAREAPFQAPVELGEIVVAEHPPPPIAGGTLAVRGTTALLGDPDRLRVLIVDLLSEDVTEVAVEGQPGRAVLEADRGWVLLRDRGRLLEIDLKKGAVVESTAVCAAPRGLARHPDGGLRVTCYGGAVLAVRDGEVETIARLDVDLRDVLVLDGKTYVSWFRSATVGEVDEASGTVVRRWRPEALTRNDRRHLPAVLWRMQPTPNGRIIAVHQTTAPGTVPVSTPGGYGGGGRTFGCEGISGVGVTTFAPQTDTIETVQLDRVVLPVDIAVHPADGGVGFFVPAAGNRFNGYGSLVPRLGDGGFQIDEACYLADTGRFASVEEQGEATAVAHVPELGGYAVFFRDPAVLRVVDVRGTAFKTITLGGAPVADSGHALFHQDAGAGIACASCHPEGGDDGFAWTFEGVDGVRRTQLLRGGIKGSEPFHWEGDLADFSALVDEVFTHRMGGARLPSTHKEVFLSYIDRIPDVSIEAPQALAAVARGKAIFERADVGCAACHVGGRGSDNRSHDVGTGGVFQTPSLRGLRQHLPLMHTGCATTITTRFQPACGGGDAHGKTSHLEAAEIVDLTRYLESL